MSSKVHENTFIGGWYLAILSLVFVTLKLCNIVAWSWWWVLAPLWAPLSLLLLIISVAGIVCIAAGIVYIIGWLIERKKKGRP